MADPGPPRLLVTGSRRWRDVALVEAALHTAWWRLGRHPGCVLVHGACPSGLDVVADRVWRGRGLPVERHAAVVGGVFDGPARNGRMVAAGADMCLAFPLEGSAGTWDCVRQARAAGIPVHVVKPAR